MNIDSKDISILCDKCLDPASIMRYRNIIHCTKCGHVLCNDIGDPNDLKSASPSVLRVAVFGFNKTPDYEAIKSVSENLGIVAVDKSLREKRFLKDLKIVLHMYSDIDHESYIFFFELAADARLSLDTPTTLGAYLGIKSPLAVAEVADRGQDVSPDNAPKAACENHSAPHDALLSTVETLRERIKALEDRLAENKDKAPESNRENQSAQLEPLRGRVEALEGRVKVLEGRSIARGDKYW